MQNILYFSNTLQKEWNNKKPFFWHRNQEKKGKGGGEPSEVCADFGARPKIHLLWPLSEEPIGDELSENAS